jgi:hypothetical protein
MKVLTEEQKGMALKFVDTWLGAIAFACLVLCAIYLLNYGLMRLASLH